MAHSIYADPTTYRKRPDGLWRDDAGQARYEKWQVEAEFERKRREAFAARAKDDPLLGAMVVMCASAGFDYNDKLDFVELIEQLIRREITDNGDHYLGKEPAE